LAAAEVSPPRQPLSAGEFRLPGRRSTGCLLVHGFTGTPEEMRPLGDALAAAGFPILGVRLAGHGTSVDDLARTQWTDWVASVEDGFTRLARDSERVAVAGLSMGAVLALHLSATRPAEVAALVLCATALTIADPRTRLLPLLHRTPWIGRRYARIPKRGGRDIADAAARAASPSYDAMPLGAVVQFLRLQAIVRSELRAVTPPALLLHGRHDHSAPLANLEQVRRGISSQWVESHVLERSWHVITVDAERELVGRLAVDFLTRVETRVSSVGG
jgi:carboxylesterase